MIAVTGHKFTIGKEEYQPYSVEIHYFRVNKRYWSICFERIRRAGFRVVSTVIPWGLHEDSQREFDFSGFTDPAKDLIVFIELAREFGFKVILRPGPLVYSQLDNGGMPIFLNKYAEINSLDNEGNSTRTRLDGGLGNFTLTSNLHPRMQNFIKHYFNGLTEIIKNYIYPRGPLFLVELDAGVYFGGDPYPWKSDYNSHLLSTLYPQFLEQRYGNIKNLANLYREKVDSFASVQPPRIFALSEDVSLTKLLDWFRFKEFVMKEYGHSLIDLYKSFSCEPLFYQGLAFYKSFQAPMSPIVESDGQVFPTISVSWEGSSAVMLQRIRYLRANSSFPWSSSISIGNQAEDAGSAREHFHVSPDATRYLLTLAMAGGTKGFNQYMFVETPNWYDAPLAADGTIQGSFEAVKRLATAVAQVDLGGFEQQTNIGIAADRLNNWISLLEDSGEFGYTQTLTEFTMPEIGRDFDRLKVDFVIPDLDHPESFDQLDHLIVPISEIMDREKQEFLLEKARRGVNLMLIGLLPKFTSDLTPCQILANAIHCKTQSLGKISTVNTGRDTFPSFIFGALTCTEKKSKKLATFGAKTVGIRINKFKGTVILLTFDVSSQGNHLKIGFLRNLLADIKIQFPINTSHPNIRAFVHRGSKDGMFYLLNSSPTQAFKRTKALPTKVVVQIDLRGLGFRGGSKVRMVDIFTNEEILSSVDELKEGLYFSLGSLDSRAYHFTLR